MGNFASGDYSFAAGRRAKAYYDGDFIWADSTDADFGATAADQFLVRASGGVGLGTNAPNNQLHVAETLNLSATPANHVAQIQNTSTGNSADVLALKIGYTSNPVDSNNFVTFFKGDNASVGSIEGNGSGGVVLAGPGNQIALWLPKLNPSEPMALGDIVGVVNGMATRDTSNASQVFVVAGNALLAANDPGYEDRAGYALVTLAGLAQVRLSGPVRAGDLVVPSETGAGRGAAAKPETLLSGQPSLVAGQVWLDDLAEEERLVTVAIGLGQERMAISQLLAQSQRQEARIADLEARLATLEQAIAP